MDNRECILISWSARDIEDFIFPTIYELNSKFKIIIFILDISKSDTLVENLELMLKAKIIFKYYLTPVIMKGFSYHLYLKKTINELTKNHISLWLFSSDMHVSEKYISHKLTYKDTKKIGLANQLTHLFTRNPEVAKQLIFDQKLNKKTIIDSSKSKYFIQKKFQEAYLNKALFRKFIYYISLKKVIIFRYILILAHKKINILLNTYIYPFLMVGRFHVTSKLEDLTQFSNGSASAYIFFDAYEVKSHKKLFNNNNIYLGCVKKYKNNIHSENKVLGILSGWYSHDLLDKNILDMYVNDFIKISKLYKTNSIDLRPHPSMRSPNNYAHQIADKLNSKGISCQVVSYKIPLMEQSEKYICIAGFASSALRDIRLFNSSIDIVAFELISKQYFTDPKFVFGTSAGIDWINCNGEFVKSIEFNYDNRMLVSEIIKKVYND
jgi:hypothetical protein